MDLREIFGQVREHYVEQFEAFIDRQEESCNRGHAEVKFLIPEPTILYRRFSCVDFVKNDNGAEAVLFAPEHILQYAKFTGTLGKMTIVVEALRWDNVVLHHDLPEALPLDAWFERWFDPDDRRHDPNAKLGLVIHSLCIEPNMVSVDLGTAPAEALLRLLEEMERAGVRSVTINSAEEVAH